MKKITVDDLMGLPSVRKDWVYEVMNGDTVLGLREWVEHQIEANRTSPQRRRKRKRAVLELVPPTVMVPKEEKPA